MAHGHWDRPNLTCFGPTLYFLWSQKRQNRSTKSQVQFDHENMNAKNTMSTFDRENTKGCSVLD